MQIAKNTVVGLTYELYDADGVLIEKTDGPMEYLHGGYEGIFPLVERELAGKSVGDTCRVRLEPDDAFGEYDADLVQLETLDRFPENVSVGMQFQGQSETSGRTLLYTVTEIAEGKVVVDGNHPLAGRTLQFACKVTAVRSATQEEITHRHVHGGGGHHH
ncbi:MAG TPA: peptidylprolyl isomerase [Burkholderiales bacterium]|nr:peptidylprolyl isomerase [Burkholderiales bacterium]